MDGRELDVPSQDGKQPISCSRTVEETQRTRRIRTDMPLSGLVLLSIFPDIIRGLSVRAANGLLH